MGHIPVRKVGGKVCIGYVIFVSKVLHGDRTGDYVLVDVMETKKAHTANSNDAPMPTPSREGWAEAFSKVAPCDAEMLIDDSIPNDFDSEEWTW